MGQRVAKGKAVSSHGPLVDLAGSDIVKLSRTGPFTAYDDKRAAYPRLKRDRYQNS